MFNVKRLGELGVPKQNQMKTKITKTKITKHMLDHVYIICWMWL